MDKLQEKINKKIMSVSKSHTIVTALQSSYIYNMMAPQSDWLWDGRTGFTSRAQQERFSSPPTPDHLHGIQSIL